MINLRHFKRHVTDRACDGLAAFFTTASANAAKKLMIETVYVESDQFRAMRQYGHGPALGFFMIEPKTHFDLWRYINKEGGVLALYVRGLACQRGFDLGGSADAMPHDQLITNLLYAATMARLRYLMTPEPLPITLHERAAYWKKHYNTNKGAGTIDHYLALVSKMDAI